MLRSLSEAKVLWARHMVKIVRIPLLLFFSLFQPLLFLILFSQVFDRLDRLPGFGYDSYLQFLAPSIVALTALNSAFQSGIGMVTDIEDGMLDKFLIAPIRRSSILLGKVFADGSRIALQAAMIVLIAFVMGVRYQTGILGVLMMMVLAALFGDRLGRAFECRGPADPKQRVDDDSRDPHHVSRAVSLHGADARGPAPGLAGHVLRLQPDHLPGGGPSGPRQRRLGLAGDWGGGWRDARPRRRHFHRGHRCLSQAARLAVITGDVVPGWMVCLVEPSERDCGC